MSNKSNLPPKPSAMMEAFAKMTEQQRDYVFLNTKGRIPGVEIAYRAAKNIEKFVNYGKENDK